MLARRSWLAIILSYDVNNCKGILTGIFRSKNIIMIKQITNIDQRVMISEPFFYKQLNFNMMYFLKSKVVLIVWRHESAPRLLRWSLDLSKWRLKVGYDTEARLWPTVFLFLNQAKIRIATSKKSLYYENGFIDNSSFSK